MRAAHFHQNLRATFGRKSIAILIMSAVMAFNLGPLEAKAEETTEQTLEIYGGLIDDSHPLYSLDPYTEASTDGGLTWQPAYLVGWHPWGFVPGTNSWINCGPSIHLCVNVRSDYRYRFFLQEGWRASNMSVNMKMDNYGWVSLNGNDLSGRREGQWNSGGPIDVDAMTKTGWNELRVILVDQGGAAGINYKISYNVTSPYPIKVMEPGKPSTLDVLFNSEGGEEVFEKQVYTLGGEPVALPTPTRDGYSFTGWAKKSLDGLVIGSATLIPEEDMTLHATWLADSHVVEFDSKSGSAVESGSFNTDGSIPSAPVAPTREGYNFAGWSATDGGEAVTFPYSPGVTTDVTLYALWSEITAPSVPLNVRATAGNKTATVSWVVPASNGGASIISYLVTASTGQTCSVVVLTCVVNGLVNKTGVTFTVQAINSAGSGTVSAPSASVTPDSNDDVLPPGDDGDAAPKAIASGGKFVTSNDPTLLFSWSKSTGKLVSNATGKYIGYIEAKMSFTKAGKVHTCSTVFGDLKVLPQKTAAQKAAAMKTKTFAGNPFCVSKIKMDAKSLDPKGGMTAANFKKIKSMNKTSAELAKEKAALTALKGFTGVVEVDVVRYRAWPTTMLNFGDHTGKGGKIPSMIRNTKISLG